MAEVTFDTLEALDRTPVPSVAGTTVAGYKRWVTVHGPVKIEWNYYQQAASNNFAAEDSFVSGLARPILVTVENANVDHTDTDPQGSATLEGVESESTFRTVTVHDCNTTSEMGILVKVIGY